MQKAEGSSRMMTAALIAALLAASTVTANAHTGQGVAGEFATGFLHPIFGLDHVVAMVAVGLWGAFLGLPAIWLLPIVFPLVMASAARSVSPACPCPASRRGLPPPRLCSVSAWPLP